MSTLPNLRHLRAVLEVAARGGVSAAARALYLSQPAVTQAVAAVEREFGASLFGRAPRGVSPSEAGTLWLPRARRALELLREGLMEAGRGARAATREPLTGITAAQLAALVAIVDQGGFGRAARSAGLARASVHRAARQLEAALGRPLFETTSHGVRATRDAERLARRVQLAAGELRQAKAEIVALTGADRGRTVVGAMPLARSAIVPQAVLEFGAAHPRHAVTILDGPYESMLGELRIGRADVLIGALRDTPPDDVVQEHLIHDPLTLLVRRRHPLVGASRRARLSPAALVRYPWIAPREGSPLRRQFEQLFEGLAAEPPAAAVECNSLVAARAMLLASDRIMLLSAHQVIDDLRSGALVALPHPSGRVVRSIGLTMRRQWRPTAAQAALLDTVRAVAHRLEAQESSRDSNPLRERKARGGTPMRRVKKRVKYAGRRSQGNRRPA